QITKILISDNDLFELIFDKEKENDKSSELLTEANKNQEIEAELVKQQKMFAKRLVANNNQIIQDINENLLNSLIKEKMVGKTVKISTELENKINSKDQNKDRQLMSEESHKCGLYREN
ncbi:42217_t:CDS:2, partial [Gigaspora margarita]